MSRKFLTAIDLARNELQNAVVQNLAAAPSSPVKGQLYFDTTVNPNVLYWWDGTTWQAAKSGATVTAGAGLTLTGSTLDVGAGTGITVAADTVAVDTTFLDGRYVNTTGDTMAGPLTLNADPASALQAATKQYVDNLVTGLAWSDTVRAATTANITLSGTQTIDGVAVVAGDRVLVKNQTTASENGVYVVAAGAWTRATDADSEAELLNMAVWVSQGTVQADTAWVMTADAPITVGTTALPWVQFAGGGAVTAGAGLTQTGNTLNVGAGFGITVAADTVAVDTSVIATDGEVATALAGKVNTTTQVVAGLGLANGGALSGDVTLNVGTGTGILVTADAVGLDVTYTDARYAAIANAAKRYAQDVGGATSQVVTHSLNTTDVIVQVYRKASPFDQIECDVEHTSTSSITLRFTVAPAAAEYRCVVLA